MIFLQVHLVAARGGFGILPVTDFSKPLEFALHPDAYKAMKMDKPSVVQGHKIGGHVPSTCQHIAPSTQNHPTMIASQFKSPTACSSL